MSTKAPKTIDGFFEWLCKTCPEGTDVDFHIDLGHKKERGRTFSTVSYRIDLVDYLDDRPEEIHDLLRKSFHSLEEAALWVTRQAIPLLKGARLEVPRPKQRRLTDTPIGLPNKQPLRLEHKPEPSPLIP